MKTKNILRNVLFAIILVVIIPIYSIFIVHIKQKDYNEVKEYQAVVTSDINEEEEKIKAFNIENSNIMRNFSEK